MYITWSYVSLMEHSIVIKTFQLVFQLRNISGVKRCTISFSGFFSLIWSFIYLEHNVCSFVFISKFKWLKNQFLFQNSILLKDCWRSKIPSFEDLNMRFCFLNFEFGILKFIKEKTHMVKFCFIFYCKAY